MLGSIGLLNPVAPIQLNDLVCACSVCFRDRSPERIPLETDVLPRQGLLKFGDVFYTVDSDVSS
jgi:hypothetical protein